MLRIDKIDVSPAGEDAGRPWVAESLPTSNTGRWVTRRKAQLISAIKSGILTVEEASQRYRLTLDELAQWQASFDQFGVRGLKATLVQQIRHVRRS
jgi:hypothetical protein